MALAMLFALHTNGKMRNWESDINSISIMQSKTCTLKYTELNGDLHLFCFRLEKNFFFLSKFGPENQNCQFRVKFGI